MLLAEGHQRTGGAEIKICANNTKEDYIIVPIEWQIKSSFLLSPETPTFVDGKPLGEERHLVIESLDRRAFEVLGVAISGVAVEVSKIRHNRGKNKYEIALADLVPIIGGPGLSARGELTIHTDRADESIVRVPVTALSSRKRN